MYIPASVIVKKKIYSHRDNDNRVVSLVMTFINDHLRIDTRCKFALNTFFSHKIYNNLFYAYKNNKILYVYIYIIILNIYVVIYV